MKTNRHVKQDPVAAEIKRIGSLIERGDFGAAETDALRLLKAHANRADVHNILGVIYVCQDRRKNRAIPHLEFAVKAEPENMHYLSNLGRLYVDLRLVELALPFLHKALAINPNLTSALLAIGKYYNGVGKADLALPYLQRLHKVMPQDSGVKLELAESLDALGRKKEARKLYGDRYHKNSHTVSAFYYFSRNDAPGGKAGLIAQIERFLLEETLSDQLRSKLHTALGFAYETEKSYSLAFSHFDKGNRLRSLGFDIDKYRSWVDCVIEIFNSDFFRTHSNMGNPSSLPVLVVGMPRSGTTLTEQIIASHPSAGGAGELTRIGLFAKRLSCSYQTDISEFVPSLDALGAKGLREMADNYVDLLRFHAPKAERVVDKLPHNFENLGFAALMCPSAHVIHCVRNPADTCWSCFQNPLNDFHAYSCDLTKLGLYYREYRRLMDHWKAVLPLKIYDLNYERLTADFENEVIKLIDFIGLPWDDACLNFHEAGRTVRTLSRQQVRSPIYSSSVERWRHYEKQLAPLVAALDDLVTSKP